ncbi:hypothetical protein O3M35_001792 [Rhynocoris fuscipes]|uniref:EKC/KEOPS complex subunit CGI121 n=1 Tax=Rhynocoris fuscipes TaxID=488301 RepID=A0AAW1CNQ5_9HEMI
MKTFEFGSVKLYLILFRKVSNVKELREKLLKNELDCALIKAELIYDPIQIAIAGSKAILFIDYSKMVTKTLYTEILFNLSTSKNITQSLKTFGVNDNDENMILAHFGDSVSLDRLIDNVSGEQVDWNQLNDIRKLDDINRCYNIKKQESIATHTLDSILTRIATKHLD